VRRLLISTVDFPPSTGGIQTMARELVRRIERFDVRVIAPAGAGDAPEYRGRVRRVRALPGGRQGAYAAINAAAWREARAWKPDVALALHVLAAPGTLLARVPTVVATYAAELFAPRIAAVAKRVLPRADAVVSISGFTALRASELGAHAPHVIPIGAPAAVDVSKDETRAFRARHGLGADPVILTVARLREHKGVDRVIRALPNLPENVRYLIVGDGPERASLEELARALRVDGRVRFAGSLSEAELPVAYASADAFALCSRSMGRGGVEGGGIVLLEASAYGLPVVAGRTGGIGDVVEDGVTGLLVDPESIDEVIRGLWTVLSDPDVAERLGNAAKVRAETERSWAAVVERYEGVLEGIAGEAVK
jgi:phosphatidylinositol alpha-1,6-mannosyltransferase